MDDPTVRAAPPGVMPGRPTSGGPQSVEEPIGAGGSPARFGSDRILDELRRLGCRYLPMNPGSSWRGLHDSVVNHGANREPQLLRCHHEGIAVALAHGYAKAARRPGFAAVHDLVGLMQAAMGVYNALVDEVPLVLVGGGGPADTGSDDRSTGSTLRRLKASWSATTRSGMRSPSTCRVPSRPWRRLPA